MAIVNNTKLRTQLQSLERLAPKIDTERTGKKYTFIFPFSIILGAVNYTNLGEVADNVITNNATAYKLLFSGNENVIIQWDQSTKALKLLEDDLHLTKEFTVGAFHKGTIIDRRTLLQIQATQADIDFINLSTSNRVVMRFEGENFLPTEEDQFKTFQIPQETQFKKPYKLEEFIITKDPESKAILSVLCVFISLEEEIAQSGQAVEQFIHLSAPGEGFAYPNIVEDEDGKQSIELDEETVKNYGITEAQVEVYGGAGISSLTIAGRKVEDENDNKIIAPRLIFPFEMKTPQPSEITKASGGEQTFYWVAGELDLLAWLEWGTTIEGKYDPSKTKNYEGRIRTTKALVLGTNETQANGVKKIIEDSTWNINTHASPNQSGKTYDTSATNLIAGTSLTLPDISDLPNLLFLHSLLMIDTERLPTSQTEAIVWSVKNIPLVGGFLNFLLLGIPLGWQNSNSIVPAKPLPFIIPATFYEHITLIAAEVEEGAIPADALRNETIDSVGGLLGDNALSICFKFSLTDTVNLGTPGEPDLRSTRDLGQDPADTDEELGRKPWQATADTKVYRTELGTGGYVIDLFNLKLIFKGDYKITFFRYGNPLWTGRYQTKAKFTGAIREWSNTIKTSNWKEENDEIIDYPKDILDPPPTGGLESLEWEQQNKTAISERYTQTTVNNPYDITTTREDISELDIEEKYGITWDDAKDIYDKLVIDVDLVEDLWGTDCANGNLRDTKVKNITEVFPSNVFQAENVETEIKAFDNFNLPFRRKTTTSSGCRVGDWTPPTTEKYAKLFVRREGNKLFFRTISNQRVAGTGESWGTSESRIGLETLISRIRLVKQAGRTPLKNLKGK